MSLLRLYSIGILAGVLFSCTTSTRSVVVENTLPKSVQESIDSTASDLIVSDTSSNYYLFDYIQKLTPNDYYIRLDSLKNDLAVNFFTMRMAYTKTPMYSPYDSQLPKRHRALVNHFDAGEPVQAFAISDSILADNYVEPMTHYYISYMRSEVGDSVLAKKHFMIYEGLLESIYISGHGQNPKNAHIVVSTKEEYAMLRWFGLSSGNQQLLKVDDYVFDLLESTSRETQDTFEIYFNITLPFNKLNSSFSD
ncbi:MAG: DUF4919 domain-containing protein [Calditrichia bacterium]